MKCLECINLDMRRFPQHTELGFGACKKEAFTGVFENIKLDRKCDKFEAAEGNVTQARVEFMKKTGLIRENEK
jgi:hypothetical protein